MDQRFNQYPLCGHASRTTAISNPTNITLPLANNWITKTWNSLHGTHQFTSSYYVVRNCTSLQNRENVYLWQGYMTDIIGAPSLNIEEGICIKMCKQASEGAERGTMQMLSGESLHVMVMAMTSTQRLGSNRERMLINWCLSSPCWKPAAHTR